MKKLSLQEVVEGIEDTRRERSVWYPLHEVLFIMLTSSSTQKIILHLPITAP